MNRKHACVAALALGLHAIGCDGRRAGTNGASVAGEPATGPSIPEIDLRSGTSETGPSSLLGPVPGRSFADLTIALRALPADKTPALFVALGTSNIGLAAADDLGAQLARLRTAGSQIVCHADGLTNATTLLFSRACSEIWLSPSGGVDTVGIGAQLLFGKSLFEKLDVTVDFLQVGRFKGAEEPFTRDGPSDDARASLEGTLHDLRRAWIDGVTAGRAHDVAAALEDGPHTPEAALDAGLVDHLGYVDEARAHAKSLGSAVRTVALYGGAPASGGGAADVLRAIAGVDPTSTPHVAIVRAVGTITSSGAGGLLPTAEGITETGLGATLARLTGDDSVKAVVLRIDSPGGSALASDLLWHRLMKLRAEKPLVVSIGGMAASGGYYLACAGNEIVAEPTSIVGSIGVVGGKLSFKAPLEKIGVHAVSVPANPAPGKGTRAGYMSLFEPWDEPTREKVKASMESLYDLFLQRIAEGRGLSKDEVATFAEGRIFGGATALDRHMVDRLGGLDTALAIALERAGLDRDGPLRVVQPRGGIGALLGLGGADARAEVDARANDAATAMNPLRALVSALPPEATEWMAGTWAGMTQGEVGLAVTPFVLVVR